MGIMRIDHPDVLRFITSKRKGRKPCELQHLGLDLQTTSWKLSKNDEEYTLINPRTDEPFEVKEMTAQFYNSDEEWYPEASGSDSGKDDNFWRLCTNIWTRSPETTISI